MVHRLHNEHNDMCYEGTLVFFLDIAFEVTDQAVVLEGGWRDGRPIGCWVSNVVEEGMHDAWFFGFPFSYFICFIIA